MSKSEQSEGYQGWANWETWNAALWISNEEPLYRFCRALPASYRLSGPGGMAWYRMRKELIAEFGPKNGDGVKWDDAAIDAEEMSDFLEEL